MLDLNKLAAGQRGGNCRVDSQLPTQKVIVVPQSTVSDCQNNGEILPARNTVSLTPKNLIADVCGVIEIAINNTSCAGGDSAVWFGGPIALETQAELATTTAWSGRADGFRTAAFTAHINQSNVTVTYGGIVDGNAAGILLLNSFTRAGESIGISKLTIQNLSNTSTQQNQAALPFYVGEATSYDVDFGPKVFSQQDTISTTTTTNVSWDFASACADGFVPLTQTTGFELNFVAGFSGTVILCIAATETNKEYSAGC